MLSMEHEAGAAIREDIAWGLFESESKPTPDELWGELGESEALFVRHALVRAVLLRTEGKIDSGDAYKEGFSTAMAIVRRIAIARDTAAAIDHINTEYPSRHAVPEGPDTSV